MNDSFIFPVMTEQNSKFNSLHFTLYSVFCNCLFANFHTYLSDQLRWAFAVLVACHCALYCFVVIQFMLSCTVGYINSLIMHAPFYWMILFLDHLRLLMHHVMCKYTLSWQHSAVRKSVFLRHRSCFSVRNMNFCSQCDDVFYSILCITIKLPLFYKHLLLNYKWFSQ